MLLDAGNDQQKKSKTDATAGDARGAGGVPKREGPKCTGSVSTFWGTYEPTRVFESMFTGLTGTDDEAKGLRKKAWRDADASGNGHASLAEVRTAVRTRTLWPLPRLECNNISPAPSACLKPCSHSAVARITHLSRTRCVLCADRRLGQDHVHTQSRHRRRGAVAGLSPNVHPRVRGRRRQHGR